MDPLKFSRSERFTHLQRVPPGKIVDDLLRGLLIIKSLILLAFFFFFLEVNFLLLNNKALFVSDG